MSNCPAYDQAKRDEAADRKERQDANLRAAAERWGFDVKEKHNRNGDLILYEVMEVVHDLRARFDEVQERLVVHERREQWFRTSVLLMIGGPVVALLPVLFPAMEAGVSGLLGISVEHAPIAWPADTLLTVGGGMMVVGLAMAFVPRLIRPILGKLAGVIDVVFPRALPK